MEVYTFCLYVYLFLLFLWRSSYGQTCSAVTFGVNSNLNSFNSLSGGTGEIVLQPISITAACDCSKISIWKLYVDNSATVPAQVYFQVWRLKTGNIYELVGYNAYTITNKAEVTYNVAAGDQFIVLNGDKVGVYVPGAQIINQKSSTASCVKAGQTLTSVGGTVDFTGDCAGNDQYAIEATASSANTNPSFDNLPGTSQISDAATAGTYVFTVQASDVDGGTLTYSMTSTSSYFQFDAATRVVSVKSTPVSGTYNLNFQVTDACSLTGTGVLTITVPNTPLIITSLPAYTTIVESTTAKTLLHEILITDASPSDTHTCTLTTPNTFSVEQIPGSTNYGIYSPASFAYDYQNTKTYKIEVRCSDGTNNADSFLRLVVTENSPPVFQNLQNKTTISRLIAANVEIFDVIATDAESNTITYTLSCDSGTCPFVMSGSKIYTSSSLAATTIPGYELLVTISDGVSTVGPNVLTVLVQDINTAPIIANLNLVNPISIEENLVAATSLYQVSTRDPDDTQTIAYSFSVDPVSPGNTLFTVDSSTGIIKTLANIDYETLSPQLTYNITVTANDGQETDTEYIAFTVINVNEAPTFGLGVYQLVGNEGAAGDVVGTPAFVTNDPDGDSLSYYIDCPRFLINNSTGQVTLTLDYDLDIAGTASTVSCIATVSDGELSATSTLSITMNQLNDNAPKFSLDSYVFTTSIYSGVGDVIGSIAATDADIGYYGTLVYSLDQSGLTYPYFTVSTTGDLSIALDVASYIGSGTSVYLKGNVTDYGGFTDTCDIVVVVQATTTTPSTTTTERYRTFIEQPSNAGWLVAFLLFLVPISIMLATLAYKHGIFEPLKRYLPCWKQKKKRKIFKRKKKMGTTMGKDKMLEENTNNNLENKLVNIEKI